MIDDEIDLRQYLRGLFKRWPLIVVLTLIGAAAAAAVSLRQPDVYEAVALVSITGPRFSVPGTSTNATLPVRVYPELAQSGVVLSQVLSQSQSVLPGASLAAIQGRLSAEAGADPSLVRLKARDADPQTAARLANIWAEVFASQAGAAYGQDQAYLKLFTSQLAAARDALSKAQSDLAAFQATNQADILGAQLTSQQASLADYLSRQHQLDLLAQDTHDLTARLSALPASSPASPADDLALLAIINWLYAGSGPANAAQPALPVQVQLAASQPLAGPTVADQLALAGSLSNTIAARQADLNNRLAALQPHILALQGQVAQAQAQQSALLQARDLASSQYQKLAGQVQDVALAAQASSTSVQIASRAEVPMAAVSAHRTSTIGLGAALGLVSGVLVSLALDYWRSSSAPVNRTAT